MRENTLTTRLMSAIVRMVYRVFHFTWRVSHINPPDPKGGPYVYGHWHGDELVLLGEFSFRRMAVLVSLSKDGSLMERVLLPLGYKVLRGSSSRRGEAGLLGLVSAVKAGYEASLAVDGPRGPRYTVKPGIVKLAQMTGRPLILGAASARRRWVFKKSWNQSYLPKPFTTCVIRYHPPIVVPQKLEDSEFETLKRKFETILLDLKQEAEHDCGH